VFVVCCVGSGLCDILVTCYENFNPQFLKSSQITFFLGNPLRGSCVIRCGLTDRRTATTTLILAFRRSGSLVMMFSFFKKCKTFGTHKLTLIELEGAELSNGGSERVAVT
jgi:hypothetical protein